MYFAAYLISLLRSYTAHDDPLVRAANTIALVVASNQPFYPLYLYWLVNEDIWPAFLTFLSTPCFLAVPFLARRYPTAGKALLPITGTLNTVLCAKLFGVRSGVEVFLFPCLVLAFVLFAPRERVTALAIAALIFAAFIVLHPLYGAPFVDYSSFEYSDLLRLNAMSAAALTALVALMFSNILNSARSA